MAQHDYNLANQSGADFRADLNNALSAIVTVNSGATAPSTTFAHQLWVDTSSSVLKIRNSANDAWVTTGVSITADNTFTGNITGNAATATALATARTINGASFDGTANISFDTDSVSEGSSNLYFTNARVESYLDAGTATPTFASAVINTSITGSAILDDDSFGTASATTVSTSESIKAYVDSQIGSVDTLAEILLNGNTTGGTDIAFGDNDKATFGNSDLQIFHDGSNSYIKDTGTGDLIVQAGDDLKLQSGAGENYLVASSDAGVQIYHDNSKKLESTASGINITGDANFNDGYKAVFGSSGDLSIYHDGSNSWIKDTGTGDLVVRSSTNIFLQDATGANNYAKFTTNAVELRHNNDVRFTTTNTGIDVTGTVKASTSLMVGSTDAPARDLEIKTTNPHIRLTDTDASGGYTEIFGGSGITTINADKGQAVAGSALKLSVDATDGLTIDSNHNVDIPNGNLDVTGTVTSDGLTVDGDTILLDSGSSAFMKIDRGSNSTFGIARYYTAGVEDWRLGTINDSTSNFYLQDASSIKRFQVATNGDISFYDDTGSTQGLFWDSSTERLGLGKTNPSTTLDVVGAGTFSGTVYANALDTTNAVVRNTLTTLGTTYAAAINSTGINVTGSVSASGTVYSQYFGSSSDTNTLIQFAGSDDIRFRAGGTEQMRIKTTGVGIGTSSPTSPLTVKSNSTGSQDAGFTLQANGSTNAIFKVGEKSNGKARLHMFDGTTEKIALHTDGTASHISAGNLGIGTTSPSVPLHVYHATDNKLLTLESGDSTSTFELKDNQGTALVQSFNGVLNLVSNNTGAGSNQIRFSNGATEIARFNGSNLGIGTTSPSEKLTVAGIVKSNGLSTNTAGVSNFIAGVNAGSSIISGGEYNTLIGDEAGASITTGDFNVAVGTFSLDANTTAGENTAIGYASLSNNITGARNVASGFRALQLNTASNDNTATGYFSLYSTTGSNNTAIGKDAGKNITTGSKNTIIGSFDGNEGGLDIRTANNHIVLSDGDGNPRQVIDSSGNVGIGTTSPDATLDAVGSINVAGQFTSTATSKSNGTYTLMVDSSAHTSNLSTAGAMSVDVNSGRAFTITGQGNIGIGTNAPGEKLTVSGNTLAYGSTGNVGAGASYFLGNSQNSRDIALTRVDSATLAIGYYSGGWQESARFDSSGNFLVSTSSTSPWTNSANSSSDNGIALRNDGIIAASAYKGTAGSGNVAILNRTGTDGGILSFYRSGTAVGSIGTQGGNLFIENGNVGLLLNDTTDELRPAGSGGVPNDNVVSLGASAKRFKDLYLSGTGYFGTSVGIGTSSVDRELHLKAANPRFRIEDSDGGYSEISANGGHLSLQADVGNTQAGSRIDYEIDGSSQMRLTTTGLGIGTTSISEKLVVNGNASISGSISKGSGSFKIDHPLDSKKDTHHLVHSFVEAPQADNIYRGKVDLVNGTASVNIDEAVGMTEGTFVALNREIQVFTSNETDWDAVKGIVIGNILTITSQNTESNANVSWLVIGERQDDHIYETHLTDNNGKIIVEPTKK